MASPANELRQAGKAYLEAIGGVGAVGTPELSHYTALDNLLDTSIAVPTKPDGSQMSDADFNVTANWGRRGQGGAVMPGSGQVVRRGDVVDVYLNEGAYWADVPSAVWEYRLGGYQVLKKWLSYRERKVLGRGLRVGEVSWFSEAARRIWGFLGAVR